MGRELLRALRVRRPHGAPPNTGRRRPLARLALGLLPIMCGVACALPPPTPSPTPTEACRTSAERDYFDEALQHSLVIRGSLGRLGDLLSAARGNVALFVDEAWRRALVVVFAGLRVAADTLDSLDAPGSVAAVDRLVQRIADDIRLAVDRMAIGVDELDADTFNEGGRYLEGLADTARAVTEAVEAHCPGKRMGPAHH